jgi:hypothetical protein
MEASKGVRKRLGLAVVVGALAVFGSLPSAASADVVGDVVDGLGLGDALGGGGQQGAGNTAGSTDPHAQGTVAQVDVAAPDGVDDGGLLDNEEVVVGRSSAQQNADGSYEGGVTLLGLFGHVILGIDTDTGETVAARFQPVKDLLDQVCTGSDNSICLTLLAAQSSTDGSGTSSSFGIASADIGQGDQRITAGVGESDASLSDDGVCQTAGAGSTIARADVLGELNATVLDSNTGSAACQGGAGSTSGESTVFEANGNSLPLPGDCSDGVNSGFGVLSLAEVSCNSEESSGSAGSNEAVGISALEDNPVAGTPLEGTPIDDAVAGAPLPSADSGASVSQAGAQAPDGGTTGGPGPGDDPVAGGPGTDAPGDSGGPGDPDDDTTLVANPVGDETVPADGKLAFTGVDAFTLIGLGLVLVFAGFVVMGTRRRIFS